MQNVIVWKKDVSDTSSKFWHFLLIFVTGICLILSPTARPLADPLPRENPGVSIDRCFGSDVSHIQRKKRLGLFDFSTLFKLDWQAKWVLGLLNDEWTLCFRLHFIDCGFMKQLLHSHPVGYGMLGMNISTEKTFVGCHETLGLKSVKESQGQFTNDLQVGEVTWHTYKIARNQISLECFKFRKHTPCQNWWID